MKTLLFAVGLLLLTAHYSASMSHAINGMAPRSCCFKFFTGKIPKPQIISIIKTHSSCPEKGFVISTARGTEICVSQNLDWAQDAFSQQEVMKN